MKPRIASAVEVTKLLIGVRVWGFHSREQGCPQHLCSRLLNHPVVAAACFTTAVENRPQAKRFGWRCVHSALQLLTAESKKWRRIWSTQLKVRTTEKEMHGWQRLLVGLCVSYCRFYLCTFCAKAVWRVCQLEECGDGGKEFIAFLFSGSFIPVTK